ncbi:GNAT family N-acetyltransferase [Mesorhizobium sp. NPDC059025]|uniref:GNAT family N-acetyltransferase n=1 Tax=unclassified Mesorhizobium TaxID=325217 RepID=UPI0036B67506
MISNDGVRPVANLVLGLKVAKSEGQRPMLPTIRNMRPDDARAFLDVHHAAVRAIAARDYLSDVIEAWAPLPVTEAAVERVRANEDDEFRLIAEIDGQVAGIGALVIGSGELRACYVAPEAGRRGVGTALVKEIERVARERGLTFLKVDSSVTAEPFYALLGYEALEHGQHTLNSGQLMACVKMRKELGTRSRKVSGPLT